MNPIHLLETRVIGMIKPRMNPRIWKIVHGNNISNSILKFDCSILLIDSIC